MRPERRTQTRYPLKVRVPCWLTIDGAPGRVPAVLLDASGRGCRLFLRGRAEPGAAALLEVAGGPALRGVLGLRITHAEAVTPGWSEAGARFTAPLSPGELRALTRG